MNQKQLIIRSLEHTYCRIKRSKIQGIGVHAIIDIPAGTSIFYAVNERKWHTFSMDELSHLPDAVKKMIEDFYVVDTNGFVSIPEGGLNQMDISFYLNHSKTPNLYTPDEGKTFITLRDVLAGEELSVDYATYDEKYA